MILIIYYSLNSCKTILKSQALFAVALGSCPSGTIAGARFDALHFAEMEKDLAAKLTDNAIKAVLEGTDAVRKLERLRLANCTNISGSGLEPFRGSVVIQMID